MKGTNWVRRFPIAKRRECILGGVSASLTKSDGKRQYFITLQENLSYGHPRYGACKYLRISLDEQEAIRLRDDLDRMITSWGSANDDDGEREIDTEGMGCP